MMSSGLALPDFVTPEALAKHLGWSERRVRDLARGLGAYRILGNRMVLTKDDVAAILEATRPCPSKSINEVKSGTTGVPLPVGDYAALRALRTKKLRPGSPPKSKIKHGNIVSMVPRRS
jgi:hypothetical protein